MSTHRLPLQFLHKTPGADLLAVAPYMLLFPGAQDLTNKIVYTPY